MHIATIHSHQCLRKNHLVGRWNTARAAHSVVITKLSCQGNRIRTRDPESVSNQSPLTATISRTLTMNFRRTIGSSNIIRLSLFFMQFPHFPTFRNIFAKVFQCFRVALQNILYSVTKILCDFQEIRVRNDFPLRSSHNECFFRFITSLFFVLFKSYF